MHLSMRASWLLLLAVRTAQSFEALDGQEVPAARGGDYAGDAVDILVRYPLPAPYNLTCNRVFLEITSDVHTRIGLQVIRIRVDALVATDADLHTVMKEDTTFARSAFRILRGVVPLPALAPGLHVISVSVLTRDGEVAGFEELTVSVSRGAPQEAVFLSPRPWEAFIPLGSDASSSCTVPAVFSVGEHRDATLILRDFHRPHTTALDQRLRVSSDDVVIFNVSQGSFFLELHAAIDGESGSARLLRIPFECRRTIVHLDREYPKALQGLAHEGHFVALDGEKHAPAPPRARDDMVDSKCCGRSSRFIAPDHVLRLMPDRNHRLLAFGGFPPEVRPSASHMHLCSRFSRPAWPARH